MLRRLFALLSLCLLLNPAAIAANLAVGDALPPLALADVASALEVGFETAKTRLRYAMAKLRACMGAYLAPESPR